jgi:hypothetical protein
MKHSLLIAVLLCTPAMAADDPVLNLLADYVTYCIPGAAIPSADRPLVIAAPTHVDNLGPNQTGYATAVHYNSNKKVRPDHGDCHVHGVKEPE